MIGMENHPPTSLITLNSHGRTSNIPNEYSQFFIEFSEISSKPVLDIGAAFGVASIPALKTGAAVYANDIEVSHLKILYEQTPLHLRKNLKVISGHFPDELEFAAGSFAAVHASNLLNFLSGEKITKGLGKIFRWLTPGGKLFLISGTPYARNIKQFIPVYEQRKKRGLKWPGEVTNIWQYCNDATLRELP